MDDFVDVVAEVIPKDGMGIPFLGRCGFGVSFRRLLILVPVVVVKEVGGGGVGRDDGADDMMYFFLIFKGRLLDFCKPAHQ